MGMGRNARRCSSVLSVYLGVKHEQIELKLKWELYENLAVLWLKQLAPDVGYWGLMLAEGGRGMCMWVVIPGA